ncbi:hypothetical protein N7280_04880 [Rickettsia rhipicephali]|nr:hypothetical protein [Rickettsia rhipicephali]
MLCTLFTLLEIKTVIHYHTGRIAEEFLLGLLKGETDEICSPHSFNDHV